MALDDLDLAQRVYDDLGALGVREAVPAKLGRALAQRGHDPADVEALVGGKIGFLRVREDGRIHSPRQESHREARGVIRQENRERARRKRERERAEGNGHP